MIEQFPNLHSRISLLEEKDALGVAKVNVNWALSADDRHTIKCIGSELAKQFADMDLGFVKLNDFVYDTSIPLKMAPHAHHMGTTRMAALRRSSVLSMPIARCSAPKTCMSPAAASSPRAALPTRPCRCCNLPCGWPTTSIAR
jgi:hypothetical protein